MAKLRVVGIGIGTLAVMRRHVHSMLVLTRDLNELQHSLVGEFPFALLPVMKLKQGVKLVIMEAVHGVLICAPTLLILQTINTADSICTVLLRTSITRIRWQSRRLGLGGGMERKEGGDLYRGKLGVATTFDWL